MKNMIHSENTCKQPFPRTCSDCGKEEVRLATITYEAKIKHDNRLHTFQIPKLLVNKCDSCGEVFFDTVTSDQIFHALREHLKLLSPQEIRDGLNALGLMQKEFGKQIGVAPETISRWLSGTHIQSRAMDNLMRSFLFDSVRFKLATSAPNKDLGTVQSAASLTTDQKSGEVTLVTEFDGQLQPTKHLK